MWKRTFKQLLKEFWIPGLIAGGWTTYVLWGGNITVETVLAELVPSFFLVSWLTGQIFRVRKQAGVESSLQTLEVRVTGLVDKLEVKTQELVNHMTGGDSFCYMAVMADNVNWIAIHRGEYHLQNLGIRVCDIDLPLDTPNWMQTANTNLSIGTLFKGMCSQCEIQPLTGQHRRFNIFYTASNGTFTQELRLKRTTPNKWAAATRVYRQNDGQKVILHERIDPDFPLELDGTAGY
ncbi:hypothetical protein [Pseudomonas sp. FW300-N2A2]|uniref:hypothetical protein n=1 Tax=Pseudomonas sp. FW300-N2A2 TaxID=2751316 RepID=UPI001A933A11|nr:hypothetical protein [Pseudomonas sp. FW300-N2A2]